MVKRFYILLLPCLALFATAQGQGEFKKELSVGGSFGMGYSSVTFVPKVQEQQLLGAQIGATVRWITEKNLGLIAEINLSQQGWSELFEDPQYYYKRRLNFVDIPFMTHIYFGNNRIRAFLNLGPKIGFLLSESTSENVIDSPPQQTSTYQTAQWTMPVEKNFAWGICGGPGIEFRTGIGSFQIEGRYYYGLGDIFGNRKADHFPQSSSQLYFAKITYLIPIMK
ncbi:hypothetical protein FACS189416_5830 [Bacteroidia bacterium]|nr:hypothetical protein FACS189416_5830 [Bacteroidia bacterium]